MAKLNKLSLKLTAIDNALFEPNMRRLRPGNKFSHKANREFQILEKPRIHRNEKVLRVHRVRLDSGQNETVKLCMNSTGKTE